MRVLYVDDEQRALDAFAAAHARDGLSVECCQDSRRVPELLSSRSRRELPDILVMDLYATTDAANSPEAQQTNERVDELVARIAAVRTELAELVAKAKTPAAIDVLRQLREAAETKDLPVILSTREGLALLGDDVVTQSLDMGAEWMVKGRAPGTERAMMNRVYSKSLASRRRLRRDMILTVFGAVLGAALGALFG